MIHYIRVGKGRLQVLPVPSYDAATANRVMAVIRELSPAALALDLTSQQWGAISLGRAVTDPVDQVVASRAPHVETQALYKSVAAWAQESGANIQLLLGTYPDVPRQARRMERIIKREGLMSDHPVEVEREVRRLLAPRIPELDAWLQGQPRHMGTWLRRNLQDGGEAVAVLRDVHASATIAEAQRPDHS